MRTIALSIFLFVVMANGQSFSLLDDSLNYGVLVPDKIGVQLKNNTHNELTIDSIFFRILPETTSIDEISYVVLNFSLLSNVKPPVVITRYTFSDKVIRSDKSFYSPSYHSSPIKIKPDSIITIGEFQVYYSILGGQWGEYTLQPSVVSKYALLIFKSGQTYDTLLVFGNRVFDVNIASKTECIKQSFKTESHSETYNILGQHVPFTPVPLSRQIRIKKSGKAIQKKVDWQK